MPTNRFRKSARTVPAVVPGHVAIIMDGNGRWATSRGRPRWMGHVRGAHTVKEIVTHCARLGVSQLTLYAFSSDNWKRPREEVGFLFDLFASHLERQLASLIKHGIRLSIIGRRDRLPQPLVEAIAVAEQRTAGGKRMHLRVAVDYSSRVSMQKALAVGPAAMPAPDTALTGETILPPVDLLVRTGGERRLSDFLLWECAYAELAFLDVNFPDLAMSELDAVFADFAKRDRRYGAVPAPETIEIPGTNTPSLTPAR
ncbi:MAG TPA: polyprenyl diphosphate synthase [Gemmatimonas sp.]|uniref:polyprenyl diphosphate synthase n=1 Tax=Gemmatimonas sp. TaxID=1962908 RepID=UPI002ED85C90